MWWVTRTSRSTGSAGAEVRNLLDFQHAFPEVATIVLDQNYRSTQTILDAANAVIGNNLLRDDKALWSPLGPGETIRRFRAGDERAEATFVASEIARLRHEEGIPLGEMAVFYRTNGQSRTIEQALADRGLPYRVIGGMRFYDRREVRDALAYLHVVGNPSDEVSLRRILNVPKRGIGDGSVAKIAAFATMNGVSFYEALDFAEEAGVSGKAASGIRSFQSMLQGLIDMAAESPERILTEILERSGYLEELRAEVAVGGPAANEAEGRLENLSELLEVATHFPDLPSMLETIALVAATDDLDDSGGRVGADDVARGQGPRVPCGFSHWHREGVFPHDRALSDPDDLEEERRLCYVGITRARERLYLTHTWIRTLFGQTRDSLVSRFIKEIPDALVEDVSDPYGISSNFSGSNHSGSAENSSELADRVGRLALRRPASSGSGAEQLGLVRGDRIVHARWGEGTIVEVAGEGDHAEAVISFPRQGKKKFLL